MIEGLSFVSWKVNAARKSYEENGNVIW